MRLMSMFLLIILFATPVFGQEEVAGCCQVPGDANNDGMVNIVDSYYIVCHIFFGCDDYVCSEQADANGDGAIGIVDASYIINYVFMGGNPPVCPGK